MKKKTPKEIDNPMGNVTDMNEPNIELFTKFILNLYDSKNNK